MLRVTIELVPFGVETEAKVLGRIGIVNDGSGNLDLGNYDVALSDEGPFTRNGKTKNWRRVRLVGFKRRHYGPYHILLAALLAAIPPSERPS